MKKLVVSSLAVVFVLGLVVNTFARPVTNNDSSFEAAYLSPNVNIAMASVMSEELSNSILDNSGNYTFFKKQGSNSGDVEDRNGVTMYIKALGAQEKISLKNIEDLIGNDKVKTTMYGGVIGFDIDRQYSSCFDATYGVFVSYINNEAKYDDIEDMKIKQQGAYAGLRANWYIGKLFIGALADFGMLKNRSDYEDESFANDFDSKVVNAAVKAGYNFEIAKRSFTIQPNVKVAGSYYMSDDYSLYDSFRVKMDDDMYNYSVAPGLKLAKTLGKCWIVTGEGKYVFNNTTGKVKYSFIDEPGEVLYPSEMNCKDYTNVGIGIEKIWGYTVLHVKGSKNFGGRDGYILNAGIEFKF